MLRPATLAFLLVAAPALAQDPPRPDTAGRAVGGPLAADSAARRATPLAGLVGRDSALTPPVDEARGVDAELRVALFELLGERTLPALGRLEWLAAGPARAVSGTAAPGLRGREDLLFLLAQSYHRVGMDSAFRAAAEALTAGAGGARFAPFLRTQLLLDAYRRGEYPRAVQLAGSLDAAGDRGLGQLVAGLAHYQTRDYAAARTAFGASQQAGGAYAPFARYMDALALLRADTANTEQALQALQGVAASASGEFADQVRLTAAQLAYESERYDVAADLASQVSPDGGLASQALLTRAWALYKADQVGPAGEAFTEFARRFPELPERDEARLMSGQALLQLGQTDAAARVFDAVADSNDAELRALQAQARGATEQAARALVQARAAELLFLTEPASGKTVALGEGAGADRATLAAAYGGAAAGTAPAVAAPEVIALDDLRARFAAIPTQAPQRLLFAPASATSNAAQYTRSASALHAADVSVALARTRLEDLLAAHQRRIALLRQLSDALGGESSSVTAAAAQLRAAEDSLARFVAVLDAAGSRIRQIFQAQVSATRLLANENAGLLDSVARTLPGAEAAAEGTALGTERQVAATYLRVADMIESGLDAAINRHPTFALRDTVRAHGERTAQLLAEAQRALDDARATIAAELARLQAAEPAEVLAGRSALATAEAQRSAVEQRVIAAVGAELGARATEMLALLRRDGEAAQFGT
ncbi:MAG TPA: hypothetical protein VNA89_09460, partial [Gemmatimonadaceae bacterium]|nr:hypothetical protein [Gemmatimonadaceae bacterium]